MYYFDYYEDEVERDLVCPSCIETHGSFQIAQEHLENIMVQLYSNEPFDPEDFESDLEEICNQLKVVMNRNKLKIIRKV